VDVGRIALKLDPCLPAFPCTKAAPRLMILPRRTPGLVSRRCRKGRLVCRWGAKRTSCLH
jgi:hypothetical protein